MARAQAPHQLRPREKSESQHLSPRARRRERHPALGHADHAAPARRPDSAKDRRPPLLRPADRVIELEAHQLRARNQERNHHRPQENRGTWSYPPTAGTTTQTTSRQGARKIRARIRGREVRATVSRFSKRG